MAFILWVAACISGPPAEAPEPVRIPEPVAEPPLPLPTWSPEGCRTSPLRDALREQARSTRMGRASHREDVDGDGVEDELQVTRSSGSGSASDAVALHLSTGVDVELVVEQSFSAMLTEVEIPEALRGPERAPARALVEDALWGTSCPEPDPSLERLLRPEAPARWYAGAAELPPYYVSPGEGGWLVYAGHTHAGLADPPGTWPADLAERGDLRLRRSAHGVFAEDAERHAWLHVSPGHAKLRWPSDLQARFLEGSAVEITRAPGPMGAPADPVVHQVSLVGEAPP